MGKEDQAMWRTGPEGGRNHQIQVGLGGGVVSGHCTIKWSLQNSFWRIAF